MNNTKKIQRIDFDVANEISSRTFKKRKGINGRKMYEEQFTLKKCIDHLEEIISD